MRTMSKIVLNVSLCLAVFVILAGSFSPALAAEELKTGTFESGATFSFPADWNYYPGPNHIGLQKPMETNAAVYDPKALKYFGFGDPSKSPSDVLASFVQALPGDVSCPDVESVELEDGRKMVSCIVTPQGQPETMLFAVELGNGETGAMKFDAIGEGLSDAVKAAAPKIVSSFMMKK